MLVRYVSTHAHFRLLGRCEQILKEVGHLEEDGRIESLDAI